ncbi:hypothetical protein FQR65_LT18490 [Abscondita terminalis]|nr:hypothetical protein FQR65_LT18490 [Abscondita terminalis]
MYKFVVVFCIGLIVQATFSFSVDYDFENELENIGEMLGEDITYLDDLKKFIKNTIANLKQEVDENNAPLAVKRLSIFQKIDKILDDISGPQDLEKLREVKKELEFLVELVISMFFTVKKTKRSNEESQKTDESEKSNKEHEIEEIEYENELRAISEILGIKFTDANDQTLESLKTRLAEIIDEVKQDKQNDNAKEKNDLIVYLEGTLYTLRNVTGSEALHNLKVLRHQLETVSHSITDKITSILERFTPKFNLHTIPVDKDDEFEFDKITFEIEESLKNITNVYDDIEECNSIKNRVGSIIDNIKKKGAGGISSIKQLTRSLSDVAKNVKNIGKSKAYIVYARLIENIAVHVENADAELTNLFDDIKPHLKSIKSTIKGTYNVIADNVDDILHSVVSRVGSIFRGKKKEN